MSNPAPPACPEWWMRLQRQAMSGERTMFALHWAVGDYVKPLITLPQWLNMTLGRKTLVYYNRASGIRFPRPEDEAQFLTAVGMPSEGPRASVDMYRAPSAALPLIDRALRQRQRSLAIIIEHAPSIVPEAEWSAMSPEDRTSLVTLLSWGALHADPCQRDTGPDEGAAHLVLLTCQDLNDLHHQLRAASSGMEPIELPSPDEAERLEMWQRLEREHALEHEDQDPAPPFTDPSLSLETLARVSAGLWRRHCEDIALGAASQQQPITLDWVREMKTRIIKGEFDKNIETFEPEEGFEVIGGQEEVKAYFRRAIIAPLQSGTPEQRQRIPKGVLLLGPAGTGKTKLAQALAHEAGVNCLKFDPSRIYGRFVGESEGNMRRALKAINTMAPVIVFVDEIDQQAGSRSEGGDSGVSGRVFAMLLEFMADESHRGRIIWIGASNRPALMDPALRRPGRFDVALPILPPDEAERAAILQVLAHRKGHHLTASGALAASASTDGWTGAELEALVLKALDLMAHEPGAAPDLDTALIVARPRLRNRTSEVAEMCREALAEVRDLDLIPASWRSRLEQADTTTPNPAPAVPAEPARRRSRKDL